MARNWREYEAQRAGEVEAALNGFLDAGDLDGFKAEFQEHAFRYLNKARRAPIYRRFLELRTGRERT